MAFKSTFKSSYIRRRLWISLGVLVILPYENSSRSTKYISANTTKRLKSQWITRFTFRRPSKKNLCLSYGKSNWRMIVTWNFHSNELFSCKRKGTLINWMNICNFACLKDCKNERDAYLRSAVDPKPNWSALAQLCCIYQRANVSKNVIFEQNYEIGSWKNMKISLTTWLLLLWLLHLQVTKKGSGERWTLFEKEEDALMVLM